MLQCFTHACGVLYVRLGDVIELVPVNAVDSSITVKCKDDNGCRPTYVQKWSSAKMRMPDKCKIGMAVKCNGCQFRRQEQLSRLDQNAREVQRLERNAPSFVPRV